MEKLEFIDSKFRLSIIAAKRAKQLVHGAKKKVESDANNPLTVALDEIYQGKINFHTLNLEEIANLEQKKKDELMAATEMLTSNEPTAETLFGIGNNDSEVESVEKSEEEEKSTKE